MRMLTDPEQLYRWIEEQSVSVFDCRFSLQDKAKGRELYDSGHIPLALYLDLEQDLSAPASVEAGRHPLPDPNRFAELMSALGATDDKPVVFYDDGEGMAARGWWLMRYIGHQHVYILNGGFRHWIEGGHEVTDEIVQMPAGQLTVSLQTQMIADEEKIEEISAGQEKGTLIDARATVRYTGKEEPIDPRAGHIPSAKNAPWSEGVDSDGKWLSPEQQRARFLNVMGDENEPAIHYCGSGVTACNNVFAMEIAGVTGTRLYPGSWSQWCNKRHHAIATGDEQRGTNGTVERM
jgi:thiosulfate/3-mercaptopyruvate sulfurtransferase